MELLRFMIIGQNMKGNFYGLEFFLFLIKSLHNHSIPIPRPSHGCFRTSIKTLRKFQKNDNNKSLTKALQIAPSGETVAKYVP